MSFDLLYLYRMPKKTREAKLIAQYRKRLKFFESQQAVPFSPPLEKIPPVIKEHTKTLETNKSIPSNEEKLINNFFLIDFKKSATIIFFILALEISLYFVSMYSNWKLIR